MKLLNKLDIIEEIEQTKDKIFFWGCSKATKELLDSIDIRVDGIVDNYFKKDGFYDIKVFKPDYLLTLANTTLIVSGNHCSTIFHQLKSMKLNKTIKILFNYDNGGMKILNKNLYVEVDTPDSIKTNIQNLKITTLEHYEYAKSKANALIKIEYLNNFYTKKEIDALIIAYFNMYINTNKIYIGCGEDYREGYLHCDLRKLPHVDIVCNAWDINTKINNLTDIYSRHMLEHLTNKEADLALQSWYSSLDIDGRLELLVPNFDLRVQQWQQCNWEDYEKPTHEEIWSVAGLWGWQRECDPLQDNYNQTHWDVHKSGYNPKRIKMILNYIGFKDITTEIDTKNNLIVIAYKREASERDI